MAIAKGHYTLGHSAMLLAADGGVTAWKSAAKKNVQSSAIGAIMGAEC
jgi:hypothetical protein